MNPSTMTRQELEDTVVILQHICTEASRTVNKAMAEIRYGLPVHAMEMLTHAFYQLTDAPARPLNGPRIDQNHSTYTEVA